MKHFLSLEFLCFFYDPADVSNLFSGSSAISTYSLYIFKFSICILLKTSLKDFRHNLANMWNECNCMLIWTFFGIHFEYCNLVVNNPSANAGDLRDTDLIPGLGRSPGEEHGNPLQYSCLENSMDRGDRELQSMELHRVRHDWSNLAQFNNFSISFFLPRVQCYCCL